MIADTLMYRVEPYPATRIFPLDSIVMAFAAASAPALRSFLRADADAMELRDVIYHLHCREKRVLRIIAKNLAIGRGFRGSGRSLLICIITLRVGESNAKKSGISTNAPLD